MFADRTEAGRMLAEKLERFRGTDSVVLALPRGGVVPAAEIARMLRLPLDIIAIRKIGHPFNSEYALGAVDESGATLFNEHDAAAVDAKWLKAEIAREEVEAKRRAAAYRCGKLAIPLAGKRAIIVDDGIATGLTMRLAVMDAKSRGSSKIIVAIPVAPVESLEPLRALGAEIIMLDSPEHFLGAVGAHYERFEQVTDNEVIALIRSVSA